MKLLLKLYKCLSIPIHLISATQYCNKIHHLLSNKLHFSVNLIKLPISTIAQSTERSDIDPLRVMLCDVRMNFDLTN